jgi:chemotaxis protein methyltransferase CheR
MEKTVPLDPGDFDYLRSLVRKHSAIVLEDEKAYLVESRMLNLARRERIASVHALIALLRSDRCNGFQQKVVEAMTTNETSFFRDHHPFEALRKQVLPDLFQRRKVERRLTIWSGACSTGQEPYTVALILREHFLAFADWTTRIFATDLSTEALARARQGCYSQLEINRGLPPALLQKYFQRRGTEWQINEDIRRLVDFRPLNLLEPALGMPPVDLVLLRNVLIYFDTPTKKAILDKIRRVLRPDGYLFLGGAETTLNLDDAFERVAFDQAGCYRLRHS